MENAYQRMGRLQFVRQKGDTITEVSVALHQLVAEKPERPSSAVAVHLVSVAGGDVEIGAVAAAAREGLRLQAHFGGTTLLGTLGDDAVVFRSSLQVPGRKRAVRHLIVMSNELYATSLGADGGSRRTVLFSDEPEFVLLRLAARFGLPVLPEWAAWFHSELSRRGLVEELVGWNCSPVAVKGTKRHMLRLLSAGLRRRAIRFPETGQCI